MADDKANIEGTRALLSAKPPPFDPREAIAWLEEASDIAEKHFVNEVRTASHQGSGRLSVSLEEAGATLRELFILWEG